MKKSRADIRKGVKSRIRKKVHGTTERPRLAVFRSLNHIYAQVIDDALGKNSRGGFDDRKKIWASNRAEMSKRRKPSAKTIAERAQAAGVSQVVFDRGGYVYHGRVKALLDASREAGLNKKRSEKRRKIRKVMKTNKQRISPNSLNLKDQLISINRVTKVVKGGKNMSFAALVVIGGRSRSRRFRHRKGKRSSERDQKKPLKRRKNNLIRVPLIDGTLSASNDRRIRRGQSDAQTGKRRNGA